MRMSSAVPPFGITSLGRAIAKKFSRLAASWAVPDLGGLHHQYVPI